MLPINWMAMEILVKMLAVDDRSSILAVGLNFRHKNNEDRVIFFQATCRRLDAQDRCSNEKHISYPFSTASCKREQF